MFHTDFTDIETRALRSRLSGDRVILAGLRLLLPLERRANFDPAQPRDGQGRWTGTGSSTARVGDPDAETPDAGVDGRVRVAGPFDWGPVDLRSEEDFKNGHTLKLHVGMTDDQLAIEAVSNLSTSRARKRGDARAGTFDTIESANALVNATALFVAYWGFRFGVLGVYFSGRTREKLCAATGQDVPGVVEKLVKAVVKKK